MIVVAGTHFEDSSPPEISIAGVSSTDGSDTVEISLLILDQRSAWVCAIGVVAEFVQDAVLTTGVNPKHNTAPREILALAEVPALPCRTKEVALCVKHPTFGRIGPIPVIRVETV